MRPLRDAFGFTPNPIGFAYRDLRRARSSEAATAPLTAEFGLDSACAAAGRPMQTLTARRGLTPPQCPTTEAPGPYFQKGFFTTGTSRAEATRPFL